MKKHGMKRILCAVLSILMTVSAFALVPVGAATNTAWDGTSETYDWFAAEGTAQDPYLISKPSDLAGWSALSNGTYDYKTVNAITGFAENSAIPKAFDEKYFRLTADLDMGGHNFDPIIVANALSDASGVIFGEIHLDGQNHTIKNLTITDVTAGTRSHAALFATLGAGSDIRNLHFQNAQITGSRAAVIAAEASTQDMTVYNVSVDGTSSVTGITWGGGLFCLMVDKRATGKSSSFSYCVNAATVTSKNRMGGIVASYQTSDDVTFSYCVNKGALIASGESTSVGGILGTTVNGMAYGINLVFDHCYNTGKITASGESTRVSGLIADHKGHADHSFTAISCYDASDRDIATTGFHSAMGIGFGTHGETSKKTFEYSYAVKGTVTGSSYADTVGSPLNVASNTSTGATVTSSLMVASTTASITLKDSSTSTVAAEMARIDAVIASVRNVELSLMKGRLSLRIALNDPYGFMTITKVTDTSGNTIACDEVGFAYSTERKEPLAILEEQDAKVVGEDYKENGESTGEFFACYTDVSAAELNKTVYVMAYAKIGDHALMSEARAVNLYEVTDAIANGGYAEAGFPDLEKTVYRTMAKYCVRYNEYLDSVAPVSQWLKVATYNVYHCADVRYCKNDGNDPWDASLVNTDNIGNFMLAYDLDILTMNESCRNTTTYADNGTAQAERIAAYLTQKTGQQYYWGFAKADSQEFGNSIISKYPVMNVTNGYVDDTTVYAKDANGSLLCLGHAEVNVNGQTVSVLFTHLSLSAPDRLLAVETVKSKVQSIQAADPDRAILFMGDLNEQPYDANGMYDAFLSFLSPTAPKNQLPLTYSNVRPNRTIDYIMHSSNVISKDLVAPREVTYSDHLPVIAKIGLPKR